MSGFQHSLRSIPGKNVAEIKKKAKDVPIILERLSWILQFSKADRFYIGRTFKNHKNCFNECFEILPRKIIANPQGNHVYLRLNSTLVYKN